MAARRRRGRIRDIGGGDYVTLKSAKEIDSFLDQLGKEVSIELVAERKGDAGLKGSSANKPIAALRRLEVSEPPREPRRFGLWDSFGVSESFFEPLPEELVKAFCSESNPY
jgi:hypothetical protein